MSGLPWGIAGAVINDCTADRWSCYSDVQFWFTEPENRTTEFIDDMNSILATNLTSVNDHDRPWTTSLRRLYSVDWASSLMLVQN